MAELAGNRSSRCLARHQVADVLSGPRSGSELQTEAGLSDVLRVEASLSSGYCARSFVEAVAPQRCSSEAARPTGPDPSANL